MRTSMATIHRIIHDCTTSIDLANPTMPISSIDPPSTPSPSPHKPTRKRNRFGTSTHQIPDTLTIDHRLVQLWGSSKGSHRHHVAVSLIKLLHTKSDQALHGTGTVAAAMLLFKRCSAVLRVAEHKTQQQSTTTTTIDIPSLLDSLSVMYSLLTLPTHGSLFATEFVDTNITVHSLFQIHPDVAALATQVIETTYYQTSYVQVFKTASHVASFAARIVDIADPALLKRCMQMIIDHGNVEGIPIENNLAKQAMLEISNMMFHRLSRVRTAVGEIIVSHAMRLPPDQQVAHSEVIRSGLLVLKSHLFEHVEIKAGFAMLMAVLQR